MMQDTQNPQTEETSDDDSVITQRNTVPSIPPSRPRARRGFAVMDAERVREIARLGGKAAHSAGTAHEFTADEARAAGRKGGLAPHRPRRSTRPAPRAPEPEQSKDEGRPSNPG
jgi:uncharacterized protein